MPTTVAIAGLTGKFAQCIASMLQTYPDVSIRGFCRSPEKLPQCLLSKRNIEIIKGEFDDETAALEFVRGADVVICCYFGSPEVMVRGQRVLVDACEEAGVSRYIASDFAVDYTKIPASALFPKESARIIRDYLASKKVAGVHILTGVLMETFWSEFFGCWDRGTRSLSLWGTGEEKWDLTTYETAAAYTAAVALDKSAVGILRFRGDRKSLLEIKEIFNEVYHAPIHLVTLGSVKELYDTVQELFNNNPSDVMSWAPSVPHHPWIDLLPVAELRDNLLCQSETTYDAAQLCRDMQGFQSVSSGRGGVIVWGEPWDQQGWEVTEAFVQKWPWVVRGSRSLLESTNYWRAKRGEPALYFQDYPAATYGAHPRIHEIEEDLESPL
ncbi:NmrA-like family protein [Aspergillus thermomutatus]|uniref:NmrA-like domain-containing protein n=1 Tax=Aspergillus thermomutatus TaxID=41047 RepID=A0A397HHR4_ASPTH|nr:uncharacterized protein CDV56_108341 [Aspergillus thermomutatus]RHZ62469.1 hypothetical protein CDV56_108341 [Aspergillus thermomutatus]